MIKLASTFITGYLEKNNSSLIKTDLLKIQYTLEVILGDLAKLIILLIIFYSLNEIPFFLLSFSILISTRPLSGGIHCKTFSGCLILSIIYFLILLFFSKLPLKLNITFYIVFFIISFIIILAYAPCRNEKRPITNTATLKKICLVSLIFWCILFFKLTNIRVCNCIFISLVFQIAQLIIINMKGVVSNAKIYKSFFSRTT